MSLISFDMFRLRKGVLLAGVFEFDAKKNFFGKSGLGSLGSERYFYYGDVNSGL